MIPDGPLIHGDCLEVMSELPSGTVDLIVTDPPYEIPDLHAYFDQMTRLLTHRGSLYCFGDKNMIANRWFSQLELPNKELLVWHYKNSPKPRGRWRGSMQAIIYGYRDGAPFFEDEVRIEYTEGAKKLHGRMRPSKGRMSKQMPYDTSKGALPRDVIEVPALLGHRARERVGHRDQKPLDLIKKLILASSKPGDLVLDPFMGSGTTVVAALQLGRKALGVEIDEGNFRMAQSRVES